MAAMKAMKPTLMIGSGLNWRDVNTPSSDLVNISKFENSAICVRCSDSVFTTCNTFGLSSPGENGGGGRSLFLRLEM